MLFHKIFIMNDANSQDPTLLGVVADDRNTTSGGLGSLLGNVATVQVAHSIDDRTIQKLTTMALTLIAVGAVSKLLYLMFANMINKGS